MPASSPAPPASFLRRTFANPYLLLVITMTFWGGNAVAARLAVGEISPMVLTAGRWVLVAIGLGFMMRGQLREMWPLLRARWRYMMAMATFGFTLFNAILYIGGHYTTAVNLTLLQGAIPVFTLLGAYFAYGTRIHLVQVVGIALTLCGVALTASGGDLGRLKALAFNYGDIAMVIASALYAGYTVGLKARPAISGLTFFAAIALVAAVMSLPLVIAEVMMGKAFMPTGKGFLILAYVAIGPSFLSQMLFMRAVETMGPGRAGLFTNLVPVIGAGLAVLILDEPFGWSHAVAMAMVLGGIAIAERGRG